MDLSNWMSLLPDSLPISEINIPGSHNAAAIDTKRRTHWACHCYSITQQLRQGIRLLDIRLKPKPNRKRSIPTQLEFEFITCHGHRGLPGQNEFQSFEQVQKECTGFLNENPGETIIMTIQIDDWRSTRKNARPQALKSLKTQLTQLPIIKPAHLPTLGECRGKIYLLNRINDDLSLGVPLAIPDNTPGAVIPATITRNYDVYVQDQYKNLDRRNPEAHKLRLTLEALNHKKPGAVLLNFASATKPIARFVYIMEELLIHFAPNPAGQMQRTWLLLDYALPSDLSTQLIASNFNV